jgi:hypothetical protein
LFVLSFHSVEIWMRDEKMLLMGNDAYPMDVRMTTHCSSRHIYGWFEFEMSATWLVLFRNECTIIEFSVDLNVFCSTYIEKWSKIRTLLQLWSDHLATQSLILKIGCFSPWSLQISIYLKKNTIGNNQVWMCRGYIDI